MKRIGGARHYLDSLAQSEQAAAITKLCRAAVRSHWLVHGREALLGELCFPPVQFSLERGAFPSLTQLPRTPNDPRNELFATQDR